MTRRTLHSSALEGHPALRLEHVSLSSTSTEDESMLMQAVRDRYRCPEGFLDFRLSGELSPDAGYFQFGPGAICYGRTAGGIGQSRLSSAAGDALLSVVIDDRHLVLPFDPNDIIDNLRLERYPSGQLSAPEKALKDIYYWLRPYTNRSVRGWIQQCRARNWQERQFPRWPVDTSVESICEKLLLLSLRAKGVERIPFVWFWPEGARGCVSMTHDVEAQAGRDFCPQLLDIDDSFGIKASFQIVPEHRYAVTPQFLAQIRDRGFEIGVQDLNHDGRLFDDRDEFRRRAVRINRYGKEYGARGFRSGVLYRKPEWYQDLDFSFDMSMPNVAHLDPQRGGCCTVMPFFIGSLLEIPVTTIQDYTLFHLLNERSIDLWKTQLDTILAKNGLATFIVHPDYVIEPDTRTAYETLLAWLARVRQERALWFALPREINSWWRERSRMSVAQDGESWRITGEGSERAVLAFAKVVDSQLVYELAGAASA
jgi:hypothetical protein